MVHVYAQRSAHGDVDKRRRPALPPTGAHSPAPAFDGGALAAHLRMGPAGFEPKNADVVLGLQRACGNQVVQRMLAPLDSANGTKARGRRGPAPVAPAGYGGPTLVQRQYDPEFIYGVGDNAIDRTTISTQAECNDAVESVIDDRFGGYRSLFLKNENASSPGQWRDLVYSFMEEAYELENIGRKEVLTAVNWVKDKYRGETLQHMAMVHVFWSDEGPPYSVQDLKQRLVDAGAYLEPKDQDALTAIFETEGKFAQTKVEVAPGNLELSDEDNIVVIMDDHQNKHQRDKIPEFKPYTGEPGTKFAVGKDLAWHVDNTVPVVRATVEEAVRDETVTPKTVYSPPKDEIDGIIYDLTISYDAPTGKYVGSYHCNPVVEE